MNQLVDILKRFKGAHLLVVGDLMPTVLSWVMSSACRRRPVPVLRVVSKNVVSVDRPMPSITSDPGRRVTACGVIGNDDAGNLASCAASALPPRSLYRQRFQNHSEEPDHRQPALPTDRSIDRESREPIALRL
jgi:bifunctional ADP-heptose synthase (sugar kinase/adenylyltransferase)